MTFGGADDSGGNDNTIQMTFYTVVKELKCLFKKLRLWETVTIS